jgi:CheY-like chemotaxis protein
MNTPIKTPIKSNYVLPDLYKRFFLMKNILVVEDQEDLHEYYKEILETRGFKIISAHNGVEANSKYAEYRGFTGPNSIQAIVMDYDLKSRPTGLELTTRIRPDFKGCMIANSSDPNIRFQMMRAGCNYETEEKEDIPQLLCKIFLLPPP